MDDATSQKIAEMLKDPEALSKIAAIVGSLTRNGTPAQTADAEAKMPETPRVPAFNIPEGNARADLLTALKPLLREDKQQKIDKLNK